MKKFAIVGEGERAKVHAACIQRKAALIAVCNTDEAKRKALSTDHNAKAYASFDEMLAAEKEVDVVVVCSAVGYHAEHIIKSLQAGKDVVCESPLCLTKAAAWQIIETEKYSGRSVYIAHGSLVYARQKLKEHIEDKENFSINLNLSLSDDFFESENGKLFPGGGLLYHPFGSTMDLLVDLFGDVQTVLPEFSMEKSSDDKVEKSGHVRLQMQSGFTVSLQWSGIAEGPNSLQNQNESLSAEFDLPQLLLLGSRADIDANTAFGIGVTSYEKIYDNLLASLCGKDTNFPTALNGARTVEAIEKIYKALR